MRFQGILDQNGAKLGKIKNHFLTWGKFRKRLWTSRTSNKVVIEAERKHLVWRIRLGLVPVLYRNARAHP